MSVTLANVKIWGMDVGVIAWNEATGLGTMEFEPNFIKSGIELAPLKMPFENRKRAVFQFPELRRKSNADYDTFKGLPGLLADALPDRFGNRLINAWLASTGRPENSLNPVEQLLYTGKRGMGALEFEPIIALGNNTSFNIELAELTNLASKILNARSDFEVNLASGESEAIAKILTIGTSAGGARPKAVIAYNSDTNEIKSGQTTAPEGFEHWLIKLDGIDDGQLGNTRSFGRVEMAYYKMASECGIIMMPCQLIEEGGRAHFMTKRFDRDGNHEKHHIQTFCAMKHYDFNEIQSYSYEQLFQTMRELKLDYQDTNQMFRRMVFNVIAKNCDDHTKNFSFRLKKGSNWELSPAYDICYAYRPDSPWVSRHALSINGRRSEFQRSDFYAVAKLANVDEPDKVIDEIIKVVSNWMSFAETTNVDDDLANLIQSNLLISF